MITDQCLYKYKNISIFRKRAMKKILDSMERFQWATQRGFNPISTMTGTQYETFHNMKYTAHGMQHEF